MARKMVDFKTITVRMTEIDAELWHQRTLSYLKEGWEVFNTHYLGTVSPEVFFAYDLAKYEDEPVLAEEVEAKRRGRPPKVVAEA